MYRLRDSNSDCAVSFSTGADSKATLSMTKMDSVSLHQHPNVRQIKKTTTFVMVILVLMGA